MKISGYQVDPDNYTREGLSRESRELTAFCLLAPAIDALVNTLATGFLAVSGLTGCLTTAILGGTALRRNARRFSWRAKQSAEMMRGTLSEVVDKIADRRRGKDGGISGAVAFANNKDLDAYVKAKIDRDKEGAVAASGLQGRQEIA